MKAYEIEAGSRELDGLKRTERPDPRPGPGQVLIRVRAAAVNFRDLAIVTGAYFGGAVQQPLIPMSDGAGEVAEVGEGVTRFKAGDRVAGTFFQGWIDGPPGFYPALGSPLDGMLAEYVALDQQGVVAIPDGLSFEEAATLPCAGLTAWHALMVAGRPVQPGDTVLTLGTGGVSMFAVQFARAAGARVIATSSSDEKLERARRAGASDGINYKARPDWDKAVMELTGGKGADHVVEVGGAGTLARSFGAVGFAGKVALIGVLAGPGDTAPHALMMKGAALHGIFVGSRAMFETMNAAIAATGLKPIVDKVFPFDEALDAYRYQQAGKHFGKVVIAV